MFKRVAILLFLVGCGGEPLPAFDGGSDSGSIFPPDDDSGAMMDFDAGVPDPPMDSGMIMPPLDSGLPPVEDSGSGQQDAGTDSGMMMMPPPDGLDDAMRWSLILVRAEIPEHADSSGTAWDDDGPDPYAVIKLYDTLLDREVTRTGLVTQNSRAPEWNDDLLEEVPAAMFVQSYDTLTIELWDEDNDVLDWFDDAIGICEVPMSALDFSGNEFTFECTEMASMEGPGYTITMRLEVAEPARTVPTPLQRFDVEVVSVSAPMAGDWDSLPFTDARPDPVVGIALQDEGLRETFEGTTTTRDNLLVATFEEQVVSNWPAAFLRGDNDLVVTLYDYDSIGSNEVMGRCPLSVEGLNLTGSSFMLSCAGGDRTEGSVDFDVVLRIGE